MGALERIRAGGTYVPLALSSQHCLARSGARPTLAELTRRPRDVLALVSEGKSNKLIGDAANDREQVGRTSSRSSSACMWRTGRKRR
jgi:DNA-binding NarL/FixJ family response regulator